MFNKKGLFTSELNDGILSVRNAVLLIMLIIVFGVIVVSITSASGMSVVELFSNGINSLLGFGVEETVGGLI